VGTGFRKRSRTNKKLVIPKSGHRFSEKITHKQEASDPEKWAPVFGKDHAQIKSWSGKTTRLKIIPL